MIKSGLPEYFSYLRTDSSALITSAETLFNIVDNLGLEMHLLKERLKNKQTKKQTNKQTKKKTPKLFLHSG
jgi:regulator of replication initiation timing